MKLSFVRGSIALAAMLAASRMSAQTGTGAIAGTVNDANRRPLSGAIVQVLTPRLGAYAGDDGRYRIERVPAGAVRVVARIPGYVSDTESVTVTADQTVTHDFALRPTSVVLQQVNINSPRMNETKAAALQEQKTADNIVSVLSGDEIRSLPNANAAEAAARMPGVTAERDEGEPKFVEIRGTPPTFTNVEIDGVHVPGTLSGDRSVKLDDVPSDLLGAIEVQKTLTADMDANAIGGTINLVSKIPEGSPRGYISGQYGYQTLENNSNGQGNATYGGRLGDKQQFGFLLGGSYDRTNRVLQDVEPFYSADEVLKNGSTWFVPNGTNFNHYFPSSWSEREYDYYRTRYGLDGDVDYRFSPTSSVYLRGLWSAFFDQANVWHTEVNGNPNGDYRLANGSFADSGANITPNSSNRGPIEHTWGLVGGGKDVIGPVHLDYNATYSGSSATSHNSFSDNYGASPTSPVNDFTYTYGSNSRLVPRWFPTTPGLLGALATPSNFPLTQVNQGNEGIDGQNVGGALNALIVYSIGNLPASSKFGVKYYNEHKSDNPSSYQYTNSNGSIGYLSNYLSNYTVNGYYSHICGGCYPYANYGSIPAVQNALGTSAFTSQNPFLNTAYSNRTGTWSGTEQVSAIYAMQTLDVAQLHINVGVRAENTQIGYRAWSPDVAGDTTYASLVNTHKGHAYSNLFPSMLLRYALDENTNVRASVDFAIARPDYGALIPTFSGFSSALPNSYSNGLSAGNPGLKPERSVNYDLLAEHYFPTIGVLSGGLFYKQISDFFFNRNQPYTGQFILEPQFLPRNDTTYYISQPQNGPSAWLYGFEVDYTQHMTFLPGALRGVGFDVNWTWVNSRAKVPINDSTTYSCSTPGIGGCVQQKGQPAGTYVVYPYGSSQYRFAPIPRQFPNLFNVALLYDYGPISARLSGQYTAASVYSYGSDGSSNPNSGDNWNYAHWQIDGSVIWTIWGSTAFQFQVLNLNNETFGFFNGNGPPGSGHGYSVQREFYGQTFWFGLRQGL
jgi:TonB-dependent receptor